MQGRQLQRRMGKANARAMHDQPLPAKAPPRAAAYHREDLKGELIRAARIHVAQHGHADLSVRKMAQAVNVSPGAPYHHFPDRRALLLAVALSGHDDLTAQASHAIREQAKPDQRLFRLLRDFLDFAAANPRMFVLMYESELTQPVVDPALAKAQRAGFDLVRATVLELDCAIPEGELGARIATMWSAIYGFSLLRTRQMIQPHDEISDPFESTLSDAIVRQAVRLVQI